MAASQSFDSDRQFMLLETSSLKQRSPSWVRWMIIGFWSRNVRQQHYRYNGTGRLPTVGCWAYCQWDRWFVGLLTLMFHMHQHFHRPRAVSFDSVSMVKVRIEFRSTKKRMRGFSLIPSNLDIHLYIYHYIFSNMLCCVALLPMQALSNYPAMQHLTKIMRDHSLRAVLGNTEVHFGMLFNLTYHLC